jgi:hypothetical protein
MRLALLCLLAAACPRGALDRPPVAVPAARGSGGDGSGSAAAGRCTVDADCAVTRVPEGGCCPTLCSPRAVTRREAEALDANVPRCNKSGNCPEPVCRPPTNEIVPACLQGRCAIRAGPPPN